MHVPNQEPSRDGVGDMFDRIADRYDLLNRILSFGMDTGWRKAVRRKLPGSPSLEVLDVATGTCDLLLELAKEKRVKRIVGVDIAEEMLRYGREKIAAAGLSETASVHFGDALALEEYADKFDAVTISFGIRNVKDVVGALTQMRNCLRPGGRCLVLEFAEPTHPLFGPVYRQYRRHILPRIGGMLSSDGTAYRYLNDTISTFPSGTAFESLMRDAGFDDVHTEALALGAVALYVGNVPGD